MVLLLNVPLNKAFFLRDLVLQHSTKGQFSKEQMECGILLDGRRILTSGFKFLAWVCAMGEGMFELRFSQQSVAPSLRWEGASCDLVLSGALFCNHPSE